MAISIPRTRIAAQLYTVRALCQDAAGLARTLARLRAIGYTAVQVSGIGPIDARTVRRLLDAEGMVACATHEPGQAIVDAPETVVERLQTLGASATAYPWPHLPLTSEGEVLALARALDRAGAVLRAAGQTLCYHHHALEFRRLGPPPARASALELLLAHTAEAHLQAEIDTYWVQIAGADPVAWCRRLGGRLPLLHLKDCGVQDGNVATTMALGEGNLDLPGILAAAQAAGCQWYIVEQDSCPGDPIDSLATSWRCLQRFAA